MEIKSLRVGLAGSTGYIGSAILTGLIKNGADVIKLTRDSDLFSEIENCDVVINAAGYGGEKSVDDCERKQVRTYDSNLRLPVNLAIACQFSGARLHHISTGCVFRFNHAVKEFTAPNLKTGVYRASKLAAENVIRELLPATSTIYRIRMPFDHRRNPRNLLVKLAKYSEIVDHRNSITWVPDIVSAILHKIRAKSGGEIYNLVCSGLISNPEIKRIIGGEFTKVSDQRFRQTFHGIERSQVSMSIEKIRATGFEPCDVVTAVRSSAEKLNESLVESIPPDLSA